MVRGCEGVSRSPLSVGLGPRSAGDLGGRQSFVSAARNDLTFPFSSWQPTLQPAYSLGTHAFEVKAPAIHEFLAFHIDPHGTRTLQYPRPCAQPAYWISQRPALPASHGMGGKSQTGCPAHHFAQSRRVEIPGHSTN